MAREARPPPKRCKATSKQTGKPCKQYARVGYDVCVYHGAGKPNGRGGGRRVVHGGSSIRFKRLARRGRKRIAELEKDAETDIKKNPEIF